MCVTYIHLVALIIKNLLLTNVYRESVSLCASSSNRHASNLGMKTGQGQFGLKYYNVFQGIKASM